jgi:hypothetical protein
LCGSWPRENADYNEQGCRARQEHGRRLSAAGGLFNARAAVAGSKCSGGVIG